jgi:hypothetical protein
MVPRHRLFASIGSLYLAVAVAAPVFAQEESPAATDPEVVAPSGSATGSVPFIDIDGTQLGTITVRDVADPFTEFEPTRPPAEDKRYVLLSVIFEAEVDQAFPTDPRQLQLQDALGFLHLSSGVPRLADSVQVDLQSQTLAPFDRVSGVIGYVLPTDAEIVRIVYRGDGSRLIPVSEPGSSGTTPVGEARAHTDAAGVQLGTVTIREIEDPYTGHEPTRPPPDGQRFAMLTMAFEAAEDQTLFAEPRAVFLVDTNGSIYRPTPVSRPAGEVVQVLEPQPLSPGDLVSGVIGYAVPIDAVLDLVVYASEANRFVAIADLAAST